MTLAGQISLNNFYRSVQFSYPLLAEQMTIDIGHVALQSLGGDKRPGQEAADRLRRKAFDLPEVHRRVLDNALTELGYS